ncbi:MAG: MarR family winged helix-turn-helix transcriptional regulator [Acidimicrobiia bacterium]
MESSDPGWLSDEEQRTWRGLVQLILELQSEQEQALVGAHGITEGEYGVLVTLSEAEDHRLRMCDLAAALRLSPSGLTRRVDGLAKQGFVTREASSCDRRAMYAVLTETGMHKLETAAPTHVQAVRRSLIDHLTPDEVRVLGDVLDHVRASRTRTAD